MDRETAATLYESYERALAALSEAEMILVGHEADPERDALHAAHVDISTEIHMKLRMPLLLQYRDLQPVEAPDGPPDTFLDSEEEQIVDRLTPDDVRRIDEALLADCAIHARKVARIVATAWKALRDDLRDVPLGFYVRRVQAIVAAGRLESRGDLDYMRFSEVRRPRDPLDGVVDDPDSRR
jgi:hypothetical protein